MQPVPSVGGIVFTLLQKRLARCGFDDWSSLPFEALATGELWPFATIVRFLFLQCPHATGMFLKKYSWFVVEKDDAALAEGWIKLLREEYFYKAALTVMQLKKKQFGGKRCSCALTSLRCCDARKTLWRVVARRR